MRVLVTGAGRAIGAATCQTLSAAGHEVVATARDITLLDSLDVAARFELDVTDESSVDTVLRQAGEFDALVNNAALPGFAPLESLPLDHFRAMIETNTIAPIRLIQRVLPTWRERGSGVIVNISSIQGRVASPLEAAYAATKFGLEAISESLHYEVSHFGIRVVLIEPGYTAPGMKRLAALPYPQAYQGLYDQWEGTDDKVAGPGGRPGPETVAEAIRHAIEDPATPLRVPVGDDAAMILSARATLDDASFEAAMREVLGLTW